MEKVKKVFEKYGVFAWWILLALLVLCACVCCSVQAACGFGRFWAICGAVGSGIATLVFAYQAWGEWLEAKEE